MMDFVMDPSSRASVRKGSQKGIIGGGSFLDFPQIFTTHIQSDSTSHWAKSLILDQKSNFENFENNLLEI